MVSSAYALLGVRLAVPIGMAAGMLNFIPYLGSAFALGAGVLMSLLDGWHGWQLVGVVLAYTAIQTLEGFVITPRIVGQTVGLSEIWVLVALFVGGEKVFGFLGVILAVPAAAVAKIFVAVPSSTIAQRSCSSSTARRCCCPQPGTPPRDCRRASYRAGSGHVPIARGEGNGSEGFLRLCRKVAWKRNKKVAIKYGFEGARGLSLAWQGLCVAHRLHLLEDSTLLFSSCLALIGALDGDAIFFFLSSPPISHQFLSSLPLPKGCFWRIYLLLI